MRGLSPSRVPSILGFSGLRETPPAPVPAAGPESFQLRLGGTEPLTPGWDTAQEQLQASDSAARPVGTSPCPGRLPKPGPQEAPRPEGVPHS